MSSYKIRNALLVSVLALTMFNSCKKDDNDVKPVLMSFGPTTAKHGETIKFIGVGLDQVTDIVMPVGIDIPSNAFTTHTASLIEIAVPEESMLGYVTLKTAKGDITSKTAFGAAYEMAVTSFTPTTAKPGTNITITGSFLNYVKQVTFSQGQLVTDFVSQSLTQLVVQVPMAAQTGPITLTDLAKTPQVVDQDESKNTLILNVTLPVAASFSPAAGVEQTKNLTITGTDLDLVTEIDFSGSGKVLSPAFVTQSTTQIVVTVPNTAVTGALTLLVPSGLKVVTSSITILEPVVTAMTTGRAGVENVTLSGTDLDLVKNIAFPGGTKIESTSFVSQDATSLVVALPASAIPGSLTISTIHDYTVIVPNFNITIPVATAYSSTTAGQPTTITGTDLDLVASITFPDKTVVSSSAFTSQSATSIKVGVPSTSTSAGTLIFTLANGYAVPQQLGFGGCSTSFPGTLLFDFADPSQAVWNLGSYDNLAGHTCNGELTTTNVTITTAGTNFQYDIGAVDWTGKTKLHIWVRVEVDASVMNGAQIFHQAEWGWNAQGYWGQAATLFDGNWHEYVMPLSGDLTSMNRIGIQLLANSNVQAIVHIDDVWVE